MAASGVRLTDEEKMAPASTTEVVTDADSTSYRLQGFQLSGGRYRLPLDGDREFVVELGETQDVHGTIAHGPSGVSVDLRSQAHVACERLKLDVGGSSLLAKGTLNADRLEIGVASEPETATRVRIAARRLVADTLVVEVATAEGQVTVEATGVDAADFCLLQHGSDVEVEMRVLVARRLSISQNGRTVDLTDAALHGLAFASGEGMWQLDVERVQLERMAASSAMLRHVIVDRVVGRPSRVRADRCSIAEGRIRYLVSSDETDPASSEAPEPGEGEGTSIPWHVLDHAEGNIDLDIETHVSLPILPDWRARHRVDLKIDDGRIDYRALEAGMSRLPDAVLDFCLDDGALQLVKDIPLVPFDREVLLRWPLSPRERQWASRGWARLSQLASPEVLVQRRSEARDEGVRFLREVSATGTVELSLRRPATPIQVSGVELKLGGPVDETAVRRLTI